MKKGYYGIGVYHPKTIENIGMLWRSAHLFGANFIFTIGSRYKQQPSDTMKTTRHVPLFEFDTFDAFKAHIPKEADIVCIEQGGEPLGKFRHPKQAIYVLGSEDYGIPKELQEGYKTVEIETEDINSLNVAVSGSIVMHHRYIEL